MVCARWRYETDFQIGGKYHLTRKCACVGQVLGKNKKNPPVFVSRSVLLPVYMTDPSLLYDLRLLT